MKWVLAVILLVIAGFFAFVAFEYFTVSIHALPTWIPGYKATVAGHVARGHYRKRGAIAALIAFVALVGAILLAASASRSSGQPTRGTPATA